MNKQLVKTCVYGQCYADEAMTQPVLCEKCGIFDCVLNEQN
ncbi:MAG: hypothetical protein SCK28_10850 [Bacillota bacterium]|nr:hypothetical protein [Bacillota bacterium]